MTAKMFDLRGRAALVTGGNSGIGLGMAEGLAEAGADVAIWGMRKDRNEAAARQLSRHGRKVHAELLDVSREAEVERAMESTLAALGGLDACFANAGVSGRAGPHRSFIEMTQAEWRRVLDVNLDGVFYTLKAAARAMVGRKQGGSLVATGSAFAIMGQPLVEHYAAAKAGVESMMRSLAVELGQHAIRANTVVPGYIETPLTTERINSEEFTNEHMPRLAIRRWGVPADFSGIAVYLASDASRYVTGATIVIDGGLTIAAKVARDTVG
ncbi:MAG: SDR family oxidoreductase [Proteobacteria bacterium]|nr:SDR family oxidoreductase [Pseudomonadota bacterium]MBI3496793.1 SDR family oxidoreductase [Pseudomonadota bacterium]